MYGLSCYDLYSTGVFEGYVHNQVPLSGIKGERRCAQKAIQSQGVQKKRCSMKVLLCPHKAQITIARLAPTAFTDSLYLVRSVNRPFNDSERNSRSIIIPNRPPS